MDTCRAHGTPEDPRGPEYGRGINYGHDHHPVVGVWAGCERMSCLYCGQWMESATFFASQ